MSGWRNTAWVVSLFLAMVWNTPFAMAQGPQQTLTFQSTNAEFLNPERGFMQFSDLTNPWQYSQIRDNGQSIAYGRVVASSFRNSPLSQSFLNQIQGGFDAARQNGLKVKFRLAYNTDGGADAPKSVILNHIQQLQPLWEANKDVLFHMDAGFIGGWGEWHSSQNGLDTPVNRSEILGAILDALPVDRTVGIRTPHFKREIFSGSQLSDSAKITEANAFDGSDLSRVGHLNDCFLASSSDFGTYVTPGWSRARELEYIGDESRYAAHGGETCAPSTLSGGANAISEMTTLHTDYLNNGYHPDVIQSWIDDGDYDEIQRRLGYRFELEEAKLPESVRPAGLMPVEFTIENVGFGELFNPRHVEVTLTNNSTGVTVTAPLSVDPRFWSGGETNTVATQLLVPAELAEGTYSVGIWMPDAESSLRDDTRYAIRFANQGVWDETTGINVLTTSLSVDSDAPGVAFLTDGFAEVAELNDLVLAGDFNLDGTVNAADYTVWRDNAGGTYDADDYTQWAANFGATLPTASSSGAASVPEPTALIAAIMALLASTTRRHAQRPLQ